jgi:uncharacterized protein (DUF885 family)
MSILLLVVCLQEAGVADFIRRFDEDHRALERTHSAPMSARSRERLAKHLDETGAALSALAAGTLSPESKLDAALLRLHLDREKRALELEGRRDAELAGLLPFAAAVTGLEEARRRLETIDPPAAASTLAAISKSAEECRKGDPKGGRVLARRAAQRCGALKEALRAWGRFHADYHPEFTWWCEKPLEKAVQELEKTATHYREKGAREQEPGAAGLVGDPIGRELLGAELAAERIAYSPEELIAEAEREFARCEAWMSEAATAMGLSGDRKAALEKIKQAHVAPGRQPDLVRDYARDAVRFLEERDLVTIPPLAKECWRMEMMSPERQRITPYFTGGEVVSVSFPTRGMSHEEKLMSLRGNNIHFGWATVHHELIPGHHLQLFMMERHRPYRKLFRTPFLVEGWALYWELLLWDLGFARSAEDRVGMLFWRMHRAARILVSLKFHLGQMEPAAMVDFLVDRVGHERDGATAEVRRYIGGDYPPLYQAAYLVGGWQLRALQRELVEAGKLTNRAFHDAVLRQNAVPIEAIRAALTGGVLDPAAPPAWRFLDAK